MTGLRTECPKCGMPSPRYNRGMVRRFPEPRRAPKRRASAASRLAEAEQLFEDFRDLTPFRFTPFAKSFTTFAQYERWRRAQTNPWYR